MAENTKEVAKEAAKEAVREMFLLMGVNLDDHEAVIQMQKDYQHLRESREGKEEFIKKSKTALMGVFITTSLALIAKGFWAQAAEFFARIAGN